MDELVEQESTAWRTARADRLAFLVDGEAYFEALADSLSKARRSVLILGWEIDSRVVLRRGGRDGETQGLGLADLLSDLLERRPDLQAHVLCWDYSIVFALEREKLPRVKMGWATHDRLHFEMDGNHPSGASHHEKVVVIDDRVAFIGGLDLTAHRWDTPAHSASDPRRTSPSGDRYRPFHDLQAVASGEIAATLGELCRERWKRATGESLAAPDSVSGEDPWPAGVEPAVRDLPLGVARTRGEVADRPAVRETERFLLRAIQAARRHLYIENQYFTSASVSEALANRLQEDDPPEILVVTAAENSGWLERATMGARRAKLCQQLREADRHGRFAIMAPVSTDGENPNVHSKLLLVDDDAFYLGSANLANRSMGLDSEAGLIAEAGGREDLRSALTTLRRSLLAEHLGVEATAVAEAELETGSLLGAVGRLRSRSGSLQPIETEVPEWQQALLPLASLTDPEEPITLEAVMGEVGLAQDDE